MGACGIQAYECLSTPCMEEEIHSLCARGTALCLCAYSAWMSGRPSSTRVLTLERRMASAPQAQGQRSHPCSEVMLQKLGWELWTQRKRRLLPEVGFEPTRACTHWILSPTPSPLGHPGGLWPLPWPSSSPLRAHTPASTRGPNPTLPKPNDNIPSSLLSLSSPVPDGASH